MMQANTSYHYNRVMVNLSKSLNALDQPDLDCDYDSVPDENPPSEAKRAPSFRDQIYVNYSRQQAKQDSQANDENKNDFPRYAVPLTRNKSGGGNKIKEAEEELYDDVEEPSNNALRVWCKDSSPVSRTWMWSSLLLLFLLLITTILMFVFNVSVILNTILMILLVGGVIEDIITSLNENFHYDL